MYPTHVSELTVDQLKALVRDTVEQTLHEFLTDPDKGLVLRKEMKSALERSALALREGAAVYSADDVAKALMLE